MFKAPMETAGRKTPTYMKSVRHKQKEKLEGREKNTLQREWAEQWREGY